MKKVFMSLAVVALMSAAVACGNCSKKAAAEGEAAETVEAVADSCCAKADSCCAKADSCCAKAAQTVVAE